MPTPNDDTLHIPSVTDPHVERSTHTTCPPDAERLNVWRNQNDDVIAHDVIPVEVAHEPQRTRSANADEFARPDPQQPHTKQMDVEESTSSADGMSPLSLAPEIKESEQALSPGPMSPLAAAHPYSSSMRHEFSNVRVRL